MIDSHTHSKFSHDGSCSINKMVEHAENLKLRYLAITDHLDKDYIGTWTPLAFKQLNLRKYQRARELFLSSYTGDMYVAFGIEAGYSRKSVDMTEKDLSTQTLDLVINSIHTVGGKDPYYPTYFLTHKDKFSAYNKYLDAVYESLFVPYDYQVIGHIGYITRYAPYEDVSIANVDFHSKIDDILKEIISRDKTIEINTRGKKADFSYLPEKYILMRYKHFGGNKITYSSDAHRAIHICDKYNLGVEVAKSLGFSHWTVYKKRKAYKEEF